MDDDLDKIDDRDRAVKAHEEAVVQIIKEYTEEGKSVDVIAQSRGMSSDQVVALIANAPAKIEATSVAGANSETFLALGLKDREIFIHLMEGMRLPERIRFEGKGDQMIATPEPDYKTRLLYMQEILKLTGKYPAEQTENKNLTVLVNPEEVKGKSAGEVTSAYMRSVGGA